MSLALYIYLCDVVGGFKGASGALVFIAAMALLFSLIATMVTGNFSDWNGKVCEKNVALRNLVAKVATIVLIVFGIFTVVTPSQRTMYAMAAAYYGEQAVKSETFQKLNGKAMKLLEVKIDELIGEKK